MRININGSDVEFGNNNPESGPRTSSFKRSFTPKTKPLVLTTIFLIIAALVLIYIFHPPFNWHSPAFIFYLLLLFGIIFIELTVAFYCARLTPKAYAKSQGITMGVAGAVVVIIIVAGIITSPIFNAKEYASRIPIRDVEFTEISEVDFDKTPIIDRDSTLALGDRVMGQMPELVSQFEVSRDYTQISYKDSVYRVTPLEYADFFKYLMNRGEGIPAYITVDSTSGEAKLVKLKDLGYDGMRYVPSGLFNENLMRKLQFKYPTKIFGTPSFEVDEKGYPWYVCTTYTYKAMGTKQMVDGVVLFDPITGESVYYDDPLDAPNWVDRIYPEHLVMEEINNHGSLKDGYLNSVFGQKNVYVTSQGYNYLEKDGDIWIYSGITSANSDAANLGFVLINLRTHDALKIASAGADEFSAMNSAEGSVKNYGYHATFPLLVNVNDRPVYLMALKDNAGLIKMYAMVDAEDYQKVATVPMDEGLDSLKLKFIGDNSESFPNTNLITKKIIIEDIKYLTVDGVAKAYISTNEGNFKLNITNANENNVAFLKAGDEIEVAYLEADVNIIKEIK